jgi:hypothetical protein
VGSKFDGLTPCSTQGSIVELSDHLQQPEDTVLQTTGNYSLFSVADHMSIKEPICILVYPDRVETIFQDKKSVHTQRTRTYEGDLAEAKQAAQKLRDLGWKVTVFRAMQNGNPRIQVEYQEPVGKGYGKKRTRIFKREGEVVKCIFGTLTSVLASSRRVAASR